MGKASRLLGTLALALGIAACDDPLGDDHAVFQIEISGETFQVAVSDPVQVDSFAARLASGAEGNISGTLRPGHGGVNAPWSWHLDPASVHVADLTIELCDGRPSFVEDDLDYWLDTVKQYCPWGVEVAARLR